MLNREAEQRQDPYTIGICCLRKMKRMVVRHGNGVVLVCSLAQIEELKLTTETEAGTEAVELNQRNQSSTGRLGCVR
jgi:hypothetical protein